MTSNRACDTEGGQAHATHQLMVAAVLGHAAIAH
jgi:hypothetical protein